LEKYFADDQRRLYDGKLKEGLCWKACGVKCPLGPEFLKELYSWSHANPLHPWLAWKVCEPCEGWNFEQARAALKENTEESKSIHKT
jgi:hypothetical protein